MSATFNVSAVRDRFPSLSRRVAGRPAVFFDGPAGSQVPQSVAGSVLSYLLGCNANHGGAFATSRETDAMVDCARAALADFVGGTPDEIVFGANMTTLTFHLSRALGRTWRPGDEVVVTESDHDANVTPWVMAATDAGATVRRVPVRPADATLDLEALRRLLSPRTKLVAFGAASNLSGTLHPVAEITAMAHAVGARSFVDAVHWAPHRCTDAAAWGCDFLVCSAYKFFGPHVGVLWGRRERLAELTAYKVRPAPEEGPEKWQTGTANFEGIAGTAAAVDYLASLGRGPDRRAALKDAFATIAAYEQPLCARLLSGLAEIPGLRIIGHADPARVAERAPTVSFVPPHRTPDEVAALLATHGIFTWSGNCYALPLTTALGLEPHGAVRVGLMHYNTAEEVDRLVSVLRTTLA